MKRIRPDDEESSLPTLDEVRADLDQLRTRLEPRLDISTLGMPSKLPFKASSLHQMLLHRLVDISDSAISLFSTEATVPAVLLARAALETTALLAELHRLISRTVANDNRDDELDKSLMKLMFGSRTGHTSETAVSILTHIDKLDRKYKGVRWWYDELSELAHPNYGGLLGTYGVIDKGEFVVTYGRNKDYADTAHFMGLPALNAAIVISLQYSASITEALPAFTILCHANPGIDSEAS